MANDNAWTPEPWSYKDVPGAGLEIYANPGAHDCCEWRTTGDRPVMIYQLKMQSPTLLMFERWVQFEPKRWSEMQEANAARIVACINACAGIPTEDLEDTIRRGLYSS